VVFVQLNGPDTVAHIHGPDSEEAADAYREVDRCLAAIAAAVHWEQDVVMVTSDHDQEAVSPSRRIDLDALAYRKGVDVHVVHEGTAALLTGDESRRSEWLQGVPGVAGWAPADGDRRLVFSSSGWWFSDPDYPDFHGAHGGPRTRGTVAVAAGATPAIEAMRKRFGAPTFGAESWHGLVAAARAGF
jgi:hypothetical protein